MLSKQLLRAFLGGSTWRMGTNVVESIQSREECVNLAARGPPPVGSVKRTAQAPPQTWRTATVKCSLARQDFGD